MKKLPVIASLVLGLTAVIALTAAPAAAKHHRSSMQRWMAKVHHQEAKEEHWARESDEKAQAAEEKHAAHEGKWETMMDAIGRPNAQSAP